MTANPPIVYFNRPQLHLVETAFPCCWCWGKRIAMTAFRDHNDIPTCADCAGRTLRKLGMPRFVLAHLNEKRHD